ncbi:MAG: type 2 lantipeptide synthetase LanM [Rhodospirillaceae bacterium]|jgi:type 2 lantibiotic biosynthesis protein LanM|nr:type 2 lantipeptide synthetase LanM [Rhodospirillaceae bacterium]MBT7645504.1 type 2 lantipeptide synthetase LanM [Rhodospirillaceae bacterium]
MTADNSTSVTFSDAEILDIANRAATMDERQAISGEPVDSDTMRKLAGERMDWWRRCAAGGNATYFAQRLMEEGLTEADAARMTAGVPDWGDDLPDWASGLNQVMALLCAVDDNPPGKSSKTPFSPAFTALGRSVITDAGYDDDAQYSDSARDDLASSVVIRVAEIAIPSLFNNFATLRKLVETGKVAHDGSDIFEAYIGALRQGGFKRLFLERPVLARLIAQEAQRATVEMREARDRFHADRDAVIKTYFTGDDPGAVTSVQTGLSDPHNGGRRVMIYGFGNGGKAVYKPRPLDIDAKWSECINLMAERQAPVDLQSPVLLERDHYGWVEFVEHLPCRDKDEVRQFFRRSGAMLALVHLVRGRDYHAENVIASGAHPVAIDVETLCHPGPLKRQANPLLAQVEHKIDQSVMVTHYLTIRAGPKGAIAMGGLDLAKEVDIQFWQFEHPNTGEMTRRSKLIEARESFNLPVLDGEMIEASDYAEEVASGYEETLTFLLTLPEMQPGESSIPRLFEGVLVRWLVDATATYMNLVNGLRHPDLLTDGAMWSAGAESIGGRRMGEGTYHAALVREERRAMLNQDIPLFRVAAGTDRAFAADNSPLKDVSVPAVTPLEFSLAGGDAQRWTAVEGSVIRAALAFGKIGYGKVAPATEQLTLSPEEAREEALRLARLVGELAITGDHQAAWTGIVLKDSGDAIDVGDIRYDFYNGAAGIAVFLAAVAKVCGDDESRDLALAAMRRLANRYRLIGIEAFYDQIGLGGYTGLTSIAYGFDVAGELLDEHAYRALAVAIAAQLPDSAIEKDTGHDVLGGLAGAICVLLRLQRISGDPRLLERAIACGEALMAKQDEKGLWSFMGGAPLTGFSHGAAGYAFAFGQLGTLTGRKDFTDMAQTCLDYERSQFNKDHANWPDLRAMPGEEVNPLSFASQWCHGSAGIGLSRVALGVGQQFPGTALERDIALDTTIRNMPGHVDDLCCGSFGRLMVLDSAGSRLHKPELNATARHWAKHLMNHAHETGSYRMNLGSQEMNPGLMKGITGIGYALLRIAGHHELPDITALT